KSRSRRPFDHALEAAPWDELRMRVHSLLDQSAEYARVFAVGPQALGDTILFDQPERDRVTAPDGFLREAAHQHRRQKVGVSSHTVQKELQRLLEPRHFLGNRFAHGHPLFFGGTEVMVAESSKFRSQIPWPSLKPEREASYGSMNTVCASAVALSR